jgi:DNA-binding NarL/FixJ family response regulator
MNGEPDRITTVILVDDHPVVRQGFRSLLDGQPDMAVIGEASDGLTAVTLLERVRPDVVVLDLQLPGLSGLDVARDAAKVSPATRVVILSMHASEAYVAEALRVGVAGYVLKEATTSDLVRAVRAVTSGHRYLSPPLSVRSVEAWIERVSATSLDPLQVLTNREREVFRLVAEGLTSGQIAARLGISSRTVETHRAKIMRKLGLHSQADLVRYAVRVGLTPLES